MTQAEREDVMREFNAELEAERGKKHGDIERAYTMKVEAINSTLSAEIASLEIERDKAQEEMMCAKIAWINADTDERKTAMQVNFERVRFEQEKKCRHIRARIDELKRVSKVDILKVTNERDNLNRQLAGQLTEKYNAKVRSLKDEGLKNSETLFRHNCANCQHLSCDTEIGAICAISKQRIDVNEQNECAGWNIQIIEKDK